MRAIVIDPETGTVHERTLPGETTQGFLAAVCEILACTAVEFVRISHEANVGAWTDEHGWLNGRSMRAGMVRIGSHDLSGPVVLTACRADDGATLALPGEITVERVAAHVRMGQPVKPGGTSAVLLEVRPRVVTAAQFAEQRVGERSLHQRREV